MCLGFFPADRIQTDSFFNQVFYFVYSGSSLNSLTASKSVFPRVRFPMYDRRISPFLICGWLRFGLIFCRSQCFRKSLFPSIPPTIPSPLGVIIRSFTNTTLIRLLAMSIPPFFSAVIILRRTKTATSFFTLWVFFYSTGFCALLPLDPRCLADYYEAHFMDSGER